MDQGNRAIARQSPVRPLARLVEIAPVEQGGEGRLALRLHLLRRGADEGAHRGVGLARFAKRRAEQGEVLGDATRATSPSASAMRAVSPLSNAASR